jgi:hypothetical protein
VPETRFDIEAVARLEKGVLPTLTILTGNSESVVLVVDDDEQVRKLITTILGDAGYIVIATSDAALALRIAWECEGAIDVLVTDVEITWNGRDHSGEANNRGTARNRSIVELRESRLRAPNRICVPPKALLSSGSASRNCYFSSPQKRAEDDRGVSPYQGPWTTVSVPVVRQKCGRRHRVTLQCVHQRGAKLAPCRIW